MAAVHELDRVRIVCEACTTALDTRIEHLEAVDGFFCPVCKQRTQSEGLQLLAGAIAKIKAMRKVAVQLIVPESAATQSE